MYKVATLNVDLSNVPAECFSLHQSVHGRSYYELTCNVEISIQSALEFSVSVQGKRYGSLTAAYEA